MKRIFFILFALSIHGYSQNIGIGISNATRAKLEVNGAVGATSAIFGGESTGISFQRNWPGIGFNSYYDTVDKYIGEGYAAKLFMDPTNSGFSLDFFSSGTANTNCYNRKRAFTFYQSGISLIGDSYYNGNLVVARGSTQQATAALFGTTYHSYFNESSQQNTYIRAGKANGKVYINDIPGSNIIMSGNVGINTSTPGNPLEIYEVDHRGMSIVTPTTYNSWHFNVSNTSTENFTLNHRDVSMGFFSPEDGSYHNFSDARVKKNVYALPDIIEKIRALQPASYEMINNNPQHKRSIGFIAQDVKKLFPGLVEVAEDTVSGYGNLKDIHSISYNNFGVLAVKAIQEQQAMIGKLKQKVEARRQLNEGLLKRIEQLELMINN